MSGEMVVRRYWLAEMPVCRKEKGIQIRYGYLKMTGSIFQLSENEGFFLTRKDKTPNGERSVTIEIGKDIHDLLYLAMKNKYVEQIRFAVQGEHQKYEVDEEILPEGVYRGKSIVDGRLYSEDQGIEIRRVGTVHFMARRLASRPVWNGGNVPISPVVFAFLWESDGCRHIEKTRYHLQIEDKNVKAFDWYIDTYDVPVPGFFLAKVEVPIEEVCIPPDTLVDMTLRDIAHEGRYRDGNSAWSRRSLPDVILKEVTTDARFRDGTIACDGFAPNWEEHLVILKHLR